MEQKDNLTSEEISFQSSDGSSTCQGTLWLPADRPLAIIQVVHGMAEHIGCYQRFASDMVQRGYAVVGIDHIGHGKTAQAPENYGVYDRRSAATSIVKDQCTLFNLIHKHYPNIPYIMLGHSMGSFIARVYLEKYAQGLDGAIIMGTGWQPAASLAGARLIARIIAATHGWEYRSAFLDKMGCGGYNQNFEGTGAKTGFEWLSRDDAKPLAYAADPQCGFMFSVSGYYMIADLLKDAQDAHLMSNIPVDLPVFVISGSDDPVGNWGEGPARVFDALKKAGLEDVEFDLVEGARHEILNEIDYQATEDELVKWIERITA